MKELGIESLDNRKKKALLYAHKLLKDKDYIRTDELDKDIKSRFGVYFSRYIGSFDLFVVEECIDFKDVKYYHRKFNPLWKILVGVGVGNALFISLVIVLGVR